MNDEELRDYLKRFCFGREHLICSRDLVRQKNLRESDLRKKVNRLRRKAVPIASSREGYFYASNAAELYLEAVYPFEQPVALVCCESGKLDGLPLNRALRDADGDIYDIVAGNFFIVGLGESDFTDLPHGLAEQFRQPEMFMRVDGKIVAAPMPDEQVQGGMSY